MSQTTSDCILYALFCLSRDTQHIDATALGRAAGVSPTLAARVLIELERAGLVDASRARLTMPGLARAAALGASAHGAGGQGGPRIELGHAEPRRIAAKQVPLAAEGDVQRVKREASAPSFERAAALHA